MFKEGIKMRKVISLMLLILPMLLAGCIGAPVKYANGKHSIEHASDSQLIDEAIAHTYFIGTIYGTGTTHHELTLIYDELKKRHPDWAWNKILAQKVSVGMTEQEALLSWGRPSKINHASYGDQWVYRYGNYRAQYLYFKKGRITSFNES